MSHPHTRSQRSALLVADRSLAQRLEHAEGSTNIAFVEANARLNPASGASWHDFGGTYAMFDGADSPLTQTFGLGLFAVPSHESIAEVEAYFAERGGPVFHETCPIADSSLLALLPERGYRPIEQTSVLYQALDGSQLLEQRDDAVLHARVMSAGEEQLWANTAALGWSETPGIEEFMRGFGLITAHSRGTSCFIVEHEGEAIAAGALGMHNGVALLAGASTRPEWRGRGAQAALLRARIAHALANGCDVAMMGAQPGSGSQRNAERQGFRIAYTRTKWQLQKP